MSRNSLENINYTINGVSINAKQLADFFLFAGIIYGAVAFPYILGSIREEQIKYTPLFNFIALIYDFIIGIPLRSSTDFILDHIGGSFGKVLVVVFWVVFYAFIAAIYQFFAKKIGYLKITTIMFGPLVIALLLMAFDVDKRPYKEVQAEKDLIKQEELAEQARIDTKHKQRVEKNNKERPVWRESVEQLGVMGYQIIFPDKGLGSFLGDWEARGRLAIKSYADKHGLENYGQGKLFEKIDKDFRDYLIPIQQCLIKHNYYEGREDGLLDSNTTKAIKFSIYKNYGLSDFKNATSFEKRSVEKQAVSELSYSAVNLGHPNRAYVVMLKELHPSCAL